jgi:DNA-binding MarR family transcriptional regulator
VKDLSTDPSASKSRLRLWLRMLDATRLIEGEIRENLRRDHDTTLPRFDVMAALFRTEHGLKMSELSGKLRVSNGNVTGIVDRLVQENRVERVPVPGDRRAMQVRLTAQGRTDFAEMAEVHEGWINDILGEVLATDAETIAETLRDIADRLDRRKPK